MEDVLREALEPVLRDLARAGIAAPRFGDAGWAAGGPDDATAMMWAPDGSGSSVSVDRSAPLVERVVKAADEVQEWAIESQLWGSASTNWPACPRHLANHPLQAVAHGSRAVWTCPADGSVVAPVGDC